MISGHMQCHFPTGLSEREATVAQQPVDRDRGAILVECYDGPPACLEREGILPYFQKYPENHSYLSGIEVVCYREEVGISLPVACWLSCKHSSICSRLVSEQRPEALEKFDSHP